MIVKTQRRASSASSAADTENLHTDVMRFMAILGLCLAAIFALVQSVPLRGTDAQPPEPPQDPAIEHKHLQGLQAEVERLTALVRDARQHSSTTERVLAATRERLAAAVNDAGQSRRERERMAYEIGELSQRLQRERSALQEARQTAQAKSKALLALEHRLDQKQQDPKAVRTALTEPRAQRQAMPKRKPAVPKHDTASVSKRRGFTLRFASGDALAHLVSIDRISFYAMVGRNAWRLSLPAGRPIFTPAVLPDKFHEMTPATVPPSYVQALAETRGSPAGNNVVWGVHLPKEVEQAIVTLTRDLDGGELVIGRNGQLYLKEHHSTAQRRAR